MAIASQQRYTAEICSLRKGPMPKKSAECKTEDLHHALDECNLDPP